MSYYIVVHILQSMKYVEDQKYNHEMYPFPIPDFMNEIKTKALCIFTKSCSRKLACVIFIRRNVLCRKSPE